jgi:murein DD-endopeptidase MepM/ murein hydrolase activator NlpD
MRAPLTVGRLAALGVTTVVAVAGLGPLLHTTMDPPTGSPPARRPVTVAAAKTAPAQPLLRKGSRGRRVVWVQRRLRLDDDGIFGPVTHRAVVRFQRRYGLDPDGLVGPRTWRALRDPLQSCVVGKRRTIVDNYGAPRSGGRRHMGIDVFAPYGSPVRAIGAGRVVRSYTNRLGGRAIILSVGRDRYYYAHQSKNLVRTGQRVRAGQRIGRVGMSGNARGTAPHVHLERWRGRSGRVVDPYRTVRVVCRRFG